MCGICGMVGPGADPVIVQKMNISLAHRGPDGGGVYEGDGVALGHRRLSIIDLVTGSQPMANEDRTVWVVFNGEIYNFREMRSKLQDSGHCFSTTSDTEVLVHCYEEYGLDFLKVLDGIFAFALWDVNAKRLLLVRTILASSRCIIISTVTLCDLPLKSRHFSRILLFPGNLIISLCITFLTCVSSPERAPFSVISRGFCPPIT